MRFKVFLVFAVLASLALPLVDASIHDFGFTDVEIETTSTNVTIKWKTTVETSSLIHYEAAENFTRWEIKGVPSIKEPYNLIDPRNDPSPTDYPYMTYHSVKITCLKQGTLYLFQITARDIYDYPQYYVSNFTTQTDISDVSTFAQEAVQPSVHPSALSDTPFPTIDQIRDQVREKKAALFVFFVVAAIIMLILYRVSRRR